MKKEIPMKNILSIFSSLLVAPCLVFGFGCGYLNRGDSNLNSANLSANRGNSGAPVVATPAANTTATFTAQSLVAALRANKDELDIQLKGKQVTVSGTAMKVSVDSIILDGGGGAKVSCSSYSFSGDKFNMLSAYAREFAERKASYPPTATVKGVYQAGNLPGEKSRETTVWLDTCEVLQSARL